MSHPGSPNLALTPRRPPKHDLAATTGEWQVGSGGRLGRFSPTWDPPGGEVVTPEEMLQLFEVPGLVDLEKYDRPKGRPVEDVPTGEYL